MWQVLYQKIIKILEITFLNRLSLALQFSYTSSFDKLAAFWLRNWLVTVQIGMWLVLESFEH